VIAWSETTLFFGGAFDPPHFGHVEAVQGLLREPGARQVRLLPSPIPPQKLNATLLEHRLAMLRLAFDLTDHPNQTENEARSVAIEWCELERAALQPHIPSYTWDTLQTLRQRYGNGKIAFVLGTDQLANLPTWMHFPQLLELCHWVVLERAPDGPVQATDTLRSWVAQGLVQAQDSAFRQFRILGTRTNQGSGVSLFRVPTPARALSSSELRRSLALSASPPDGIPPKVLEYLKQKRLYGSP
jgi:nicotinate-nucleotide adenylyltransferase